MSPTYSTRLRIDSAHSRLTARPACPLHIARLALHFGGRFREMHVAEGVGVQEDGDEDGD